MNSSIVISLLGVIGFAIFTMQSYYTTISRMETVFPATVAPGAVGIIFYFLCILIPLIIYLYLLKGEKKVSWMAVSWFFFWVLFLTSWLTFGHIGDSVWDSSQRFSAGMQLFFHIIKYVLFIVPLALIFTGSGTWGLKIIGILDSVPTYLKIPLTLWLGWSAFIIEFAVIGFFGFYNIWVFYGLIAIKIACSYREIWEIMKDISGRSFNISENDYDIVRLIINCLLLVTLFVVISMNLVNIVRPYPIGWDDLGVYMNYPKLIALSESTSNMGIVLWQTFTGIGFLHKSATFAFFLNQFGSIFAISAILGGLRFFVRKNNPIVSLPLLATTIFMGLPMIVFQQAKDMKLDPGLFGITILAVVTLFLAFEQKEQRTRNLWYILAGWLIGIAFGIKATTLMVIIAWLATIFYRELGMTGFFGFLSIFIGSFTSLRLWDMMNVNYPKDSPNLLAFWGTTILLGIVLSGLSLKLKDISKEDIFRNLFLPIALVGIGFIATFGPWLIKNGIEGVKIWPVNVGVLLSGDTKSFIPDYTTIRTTKELEEIKEKSRQNAISQDGKTLNEDLGRYFGYETGLSNFLKLPINLTLQSNQKGEFTDISYIFLAILPGIILLRFRRKPMMSAYGIYLILLFLLYFFKAPGFNMLLSSIQLPIGYIFIIATAVLPLGLLHIDNKSTGKNAEDTIFLSLFAFVTMYCLIFLVAAYGIVWYGIFMYFGFLAIIAMCMNSERFSESQKAWIGGIVVLLVSPYFLVSVIPHAWTNLPEDSMDFKVWKVSEFEGIFQGRPEYVKVLEKFNLKDSSKARDKIITAATNPDLKKILGNYHEASINEIIGILEMAQQLGIEKNTPQYQALMLDARKVKEMAYGEILYPNADNRNSEKIYRMGTFLTYYISQNRSRFYDDSLITQFWTYFKGENSNESVANMKKIGIKYVLLDLNAATIDRDPRHDLTRRYEEILDFIKSDKIKLVATDSLCLQVGLELKGDKNYINLAGTNYVSYIKGDDGQIRAIGPKEKTEFCGKVLAQIIMENRVTEHDFSYLKPLSDFVLSKKPKTQEDATNIILPYIGRSWMASFEILP